VTIVISLSPKSTGSNTIIVRTVRSILKANEQLETSIMFRRFIKTDRGYSYRRKKNYGGGVVARCDSCNKFFPWMNIRYGLGCPRCDGKRYQERLKALGL
jgi:hypothetical protein